MSDSSVSVSRRAMMTDRSAGFQADASMHGQTAMPALEMGVSEYQRPRRRRKKSAPRKSVSGTGAPPAWLLAVGVLAGLVMLIGIAGFTIGRVLDRLSDPGDASEDPTLAETASNMAAPPETRQEPESVPLSPERIATFEESLPSSIVVDSVTDVPHTNRSETPNPSDQFPTFPDSGTQSVRSLAFSASASGVASVTQPR